MFIVHVQNVRIEEIPNPKHPHQKLLTLSYLNRQYILVQGFPHSRLDSAQNLWRHLTDDRSQVCLIVKENQQYSVWVENIQKSVTTDPPDLRLESVFRAQMYLIDGLLAEVLELLGQNQAEAFAKEILASIPTILSLKDLTAAISIAMQPDKSIDAYALSGQQLSKLYQEIQRLGGKYLGKNYTKELLGDLQQQLSPRLNQSFQSWSIKQSTL
jgi:hypothetical protein